MKRKYIKFNDAVKMLNEGWEIFTDRGFGGAPYNPLFFYLHKGDEQLEVHHSTIKKLISEKIINSKDNESGTGKYKLR